MARRRGCSSGGTSHCIIPFPSGSLIALQVLDRFLSTKKRSSQLGATNPLSAGSEKCSKSSRIAKYASDRDQLDTDTTSRLRYMYLIAEWKTIHPNSSPF